jgi:EAL domain-containing protein (putative c-di-GMP-specific phosphodiesterase class I)
VFTTACQQINYLHKKGFSDLKVAINLSGEQFKTDNLNQRLLKILNTVDLTPQFIEVELTESTLVHDVKLGIQNLQGLKALGMTVSVDDFGTGYSSLSYLKHFSFDILKIDRSFIQDIHQDFKQQAIVKAMISMAHQLNLKVIAEGVETEAELNFLRQNGCDAAQGYFISKPLPWQQFKQFIQQPATLPVSS